MPDWSTPNLKYLSSEQALADLATILAYFRAGSSKPTIMIGGSYPGALSAWFRTRYPHIAIADYWQYDEQLYTAT
jgi:hypothetical protein